jgi:hypothetical protein
MVALAVILPLATQVLRVVEQSQITFNNAPEEYKAKYFERLMKWEAVWDKVFDPLLKAITAEQPKDPN